MQTVKISALALSVMVAATQMAVASQQPESKGFVEGSKLNVKNRNIYFKDDFRSSGAPKSYTEEWGHGLIGTFQSGFTQGTVGFGVDALGMVGLKLDTGRGRVGSGLFPVGDDGKAQDEFSQAGAVVKARVSNTTFKYGDQIISNPVFAMSDSRILPETARGALITSEEIDNLVLQAGHFTSLSAKAATGHDSIVRGGQTLKSIDFIGANYIVNDQLSGAVFYSNTEDFFRKWYGNLNFVQPLSDKQALSFDFNIYDTKSIGQEYLGDLSNRAWSLAAAYSVGAHRFTVAHQRISGRGGYTYKIDGGSSMFLANSVQYSDFNFEDERSWQARYDLNMKSFGVPGLTFMTRYIRGDNITTNQTNNGKQWERDIEARYVVQGGPAKDLSLRARYATHRSADVERDVDQLRLIVEYPLSIL